MSVQLQVSPQSEGRDAAPGSVLSSSALLVSQAFSMGSVMNESVSSALLRLPPADAVMRLQFGSLDLILEDAPPPARWTWIADLIDSEWGLASAIDSLMSRSAHRELVRVSTMCRASAHHRVSTESWGKALTAMEKLEPSSERSVTSALAAAYEIALECSDTTSPDLTAAATLAFEAFTTLAVDPELVRNRLLHAMIELAAYTTLYTDRIVELPLSG